MDIHLPNHQFETAIERLVRVNILSQHYHWTTNDFIQSRCKRLRGQCCVSARWILHKTESFNKWKHKTEAFNKWKHKTETFNKWKQIYTNTRKSTQGGLNSNVRAYCRHWHEQPYSRWTNYSNPGQLYPPRPPNFKVVVFFQGLRRVDKTNQTPQHDISRTHSLTLTFGEGGVFQSFPRGLNILSIYGPGR